MVLDSGVERYMIVVGWVEACLEELTLVDERSKLCNFPNLSQTELSSV
jgi:hypothetical protein